MTDNDRELLEMAAKAAEIEITFEHGRPQRIEMFRGHLPNYEDWNPLADDGDALRLASVLEIDIEFHVNVEAIAWGRWADGEQRHTFKEQGLSLAATRRAIVRAAAAIGESMK